MRHFRATALSLIFSVSVPLWAQELSQNGDFEVPSTAGLTCFQNTVSSSWTFFGPGGNQGSCFVQSGTTSGGFTWPLAHTGSQLMLVNRQEFVGTKIAQNVSLVAGTEYQLAFSMAGVNGDATVPSVSVALASVGSRSFSTAADAVWSDKAWTFTAASSGSFILSFAAVTGLVNVDSVSLQATVVPEADKAALLTAGLAVLAGVTIRRRRRDC